MDMRNKQPNGLTHARVNLSESEKSGWVRAFNGNDPNFWPLLFKNSILLKKFMKFGFIQNIE